MDIRKMKLQELKDYAGTLAKQYNIHFKKSVHGKNKSDLCHFIENIESFKGDDDDLHHKSKAELLKMLEDRPDYNKSFSKKNKKTLIEIIQSVHIPDQESCPQDDHCVSPIHFDDLIENPNVDRLKEAIARCFSEKPFDDSTYQEIQRSIFKN